MFLEMFYDLGYRALDSGFRVVCVRDCSENPFVKCNGTKDCSEKPDRNGHAKKKTASKSTSSFVAITPLKRSFAGLYL